MKRYQRRQKGAEETEAEPRKLEERIGLETLVVLEVNKQQKGKKKLRQRSSRET